jgi:hypothetical protein
MIELTLHGEPDSYGDYHIAVHLPDGRTITVLIPVGKTWVVQDGLEYGLNLVTEHHYT